MAFDFSRCRSIIVQGILDALDSKASAIASIDQIPNVEFPIDGIALDMAPWHGGMGLALRQVTEFEHESRYNSADWDYFDFVSNSSFSGLQVAANFIKEAYLSEGEGSPARLEMAHLVFLAGAEALLDSRVAECLCALGINAPVYANGFLGRRFEYMVFDPDETVRMNYCELVLANRVTAKWLTRKT